MSHRLQDVLLHENRCVCLTKSTKWSRHREQSGDAPHLEAGEELSELREERKEDEADEVGLRGRLGHLVAVHERGHRQALEFLRVALHARTKSQVDSVNVCKKNRKLEFLFQLKTENLVEELLQQTVEPGLGHGHRPGLVGDVAHLHHDLHQLRRIKRRSPVKRPERLYHNHLSGLTTSLCSLLLKSNTGWMTLNLLRISLCRAMSVARMHLEGHGGRIIVESLTTG